MFALFSWFYESFGITDLLLARLKGAVALFIGLIIGIIHYKLSTDINNDQILYGSSPIKKISLTHSVN